MMAHVSRSQSEAQSGVKEKMTRKVYLCLCLQKTNEKKQQTAQGICKSQPAMAECI
uniref:Uncharacterized protein n=1 Tax=Setaria italica TaxID=4555 RepID=K3YXL9_SETIT